MKELVIISGKGGTGKTSITASFAAMAENVVMADCDVDAADLHLVLQPRIQKRFDFISGHEAIIRPDACIACGACLAHCRFDAVREDGRGAGESVFTIDPISCEGCGVCVRFCPVQAIDFPESHCGEWYVSDTRFGPLVHARLGAGAENSGKLVSVVRTEAKRIAAERGRSAVLVDGPPGIACPVIASVTGASAVLVVTEPTLSGLHDLERVLRLVRHFGISTFVCVNKWDINPATSDLIEKTAAEAGARSIGKIPYDRAVTDAQVQGKSLVEHSDGPAARSVRNIWEDLKCRKVL